MIYVYVCDANKQTMCSAFPLQVKTKFTLFFLLSDDLLFAVQPDFTKTNFKLRKMKTIALKMIEYFLCEFV